MSENEASARADSCTTDPEMAGARRRIGGLEDPELMTVGAECAKDRIAHNEAPYYPIGIGQAVFLLSDNSDPAP